MNAEEIDRLLEKYYKGESSEEEESILREYFDTEDVLDGYEAEKEIFGYYKKTKMIPEPSADFEARIFEAIDTTEIRKESARFSRYLLPLLGAAASILIVAGSYFFFEQKINLKDTYKDPKIAYNETVKILLNVSSKMNHATLALEPVSKINTMTTKSFKAINKSTVIIEKNLKNLDYLKNSKF